MPPLPVEEDPELTENEQWEAVVLAATIEAFERQWLEAEPMEKRHHGKEQEVEAMEMQKQRRVEELEQQQRQEEATRKAARKDWS